MLVLTFCLGSSPGSAQTHFQPAENLAREAGISAEGGFPLVVVYTRPKCPYCERVKRDHLRHLLSDGRYQGRLVLRELDQTDTRSLMDFKGQETTPKAFALSRKVKLVPVVAFYGPGGEDLAPPIVGARIADYYQTDLEEAITQASRKLKAGGG